jgi:hypothetical protein
MVRVGFPKGIMPDRAPARLSGEADHPSGDRPSKSIIIMGASLQQLLFTPV